MKLYIPSLGDDLKLTENWTFWLYAEHRNSKLGVILGLRDESRSNWNDSAWSKTHHAVEIIETTFPHSNYVKQDFRYGVWLPKDTILRVDRIYIRKGSSDFDSVSFRIVECPSNKKLCKQRFWVKLEDANQIVFEPQTEGQK